MLLEILLPRFQHVLKLNIQSIRSCDPQKLGHIDVRPHYVSLHISFVGQPQQDMMRFAYLIDNKYSSVSPTSFLRMI